MCTDARQCFTLAVKLYGCFTDGGFQALLIARQFAGINPGLTELLTLTLYGQPETVIFELKVSRAFLRELERPSLCAGRIFGVFKLDGQRGGFLLCLFQ